MLDPFARFPDVVRGAFATARARYIGMKGVTGVDIGCECQHGDEQRGCVLRIHRDPAGPPGWSPELQCIPPSIDGLPVRTLEASYRVDVIAPLSVSDIPKRPRGRARPLRAGFAINGLLQNIGTLGLIVFDRDTDAPGLLSNSHVFGDHRRVPGNPIFQPTLTFGGSMSGDTVATLTDSLLDDKGDAAVGRICDGREFCRAQWHDPLLVIEDAVLPKCWDPVAKSGAGSGETNGIVTGIGMYDPADADSPPFYGMCIRSADARHPVSAPGDSGSVWFRSDGRGVGLHVAGSESGSQPQLAIACMLPTVLDALNVRLTPSGPSPAGTVDCPPIPAAFRARQPR